MRLKLIKGMSYRGMGVCLKKGEIVSVDGSVAKALLDTGKFEEVKDAAASRLAAESNEIMKQWCMPEPGQIKPETNKPLEKMSKAELVSFAEANEVDISACNNNDERIAAIKAVLEAVSGVSADDGDANVNGDGSPDFEA